MSTRQTITAGEQLSAPTNHQTTDKQLSKRLHDLLVRSDAVLRNAAELVKKNAFTHEEIKDAQARLEEVICQSEEILEKMQERKARQNARDPFSDRL